MDVAAFLDDIRRQSWYADQLSHVEVLPAREGQLADPSVPMPAALVELLGRCGIERLYSHQVEALEAARARP